MSAAVVALAVVGGLILVAALWLAWSYNRFVTQRQAVANSWSNIDTELRRRHDLVPNLVRTVAGYAAHERAVFEEVAQARAGAVAAAHTPLDAAHPSAAAEVSGPERALTDGLRRLVAVAEAYPTLQASEQYLDLQRQLVTTEDRIQVARRLYNANVRDLNERVQSIPSNVVARLGGFEQQAYFALEPAAGAVPSVGPGSFGPGG